MFAVAQQKRLAMREQVTFYSDDTRTNPLFGFRARQKMDLAARYDVTAADGTPLGAFQKDFGASLMCSSFHLFGPDLEAYGQERSSATAILRPALRFASTTRCAESTSCAGRSVSVTLPGTAAGRERRTCRRRARSSSDTGAPSRRCSPCYAPATAPVA